MQIDEVKSLKIDRQKIITCRKEDSAFTALMLMKRNNIHHLPVMDGESVVGMISDRQIFARAFEKDHLASLESIEVKNVMQQNVPEISAKSQMREVITMMTQGPYDALPVVEQGRLTGIVSTTDVLKLTAKLTGSEEDILYGTAFLANPFAQRILSLLADIGI